MSATTIDRAMNRITSFGDAVAPLTSRQTRGARPRFSAIDGVPADVRIDPAVGAVVVAATVAGAAFGAATEQGVRRWTGATVVGCGVAYLAVSLIDFAEHMRLEREVTGHYLSTAVVPLGETINHAGSVLAVIAMLAAARPKAKTANRKKQKKRGLGRWITLLAPAAFTLLGWRDELVYHRRRSTHREDMLHTVAHLAAGGMLVGLYLHRSTDE